MIIENKNRFNDCRLWWNMLILNQSVISRFIYLTIKNKEVRHLIQSGGVDIPYIYTGLEKIRWNGQL